MALPWRGIDFSPRQTFSGMLFSRNRCGCIRVVEEDRDRRKNEWMTALHENCRTGVENVFSTEGIGARFRMMRISVEIKGDDEKVRFVTKDV